MKKKIIYASLLLGVCVLTGVSTYKKSSTFGETKLWCALTCESEASPTENFAAGAYGCFMSSMSGALAGAAFGGPAGFAVGLGMGL